jgi:omega-6 fatty acid desaturase (delta-12 desaturase)
LQSDRPLGLDGARAWTRLLAGYRAPSHVRSVLEIAVTLLPFAGFWVLSWAAVHYGYWQLSLLLAIPGTAFLVRLFMIQHDCGHGSFFRNRYFNDGVGRLIGVLTLTPYDAWRLAHANHHATSGNLDRRGIGDIDTLTVREFNALSIWGRLGYRAYRHPLVMFVIGPAYLFLFQNRVPSRLRFHCRVSWISAMSTNLAIAAIAGLLIWFLGLREFLLVHVPITVLAASVGVWLFYVQHQFEEAFWARDEEWSRHDAALRGSSHYVLPGVLRWLTANIGAHHVHHLCSGIPYYRLPRVLRDHPELSKMNRITFVQSLRGVRLVLWDEAHRRLVSFREARSA